MEDILEGVCCVLYDVSVHDLLLIDVSLLLFPPLTLLSFLSQKLLPVLLFPSFSSSLSILHVLLPPELRLSVMCLFLSLPFFSLSSSSSFFSSQVSHLWSIRLIILSWRTHAEIELISLPLQLLSFLLLNRSIKPGRRSSQDRCL